MIHPTLLTCHISDTLKLETEDGLANTISKITITPDTEKVNTIRFYLMISNLFNETKDE